LFLFIHVCFFFKKKLEKSKKGLTDEPAPEEENKPKGIILFISFLFCVYSCLFLFLGGLTDNPENEEEEEEEDDQRKKNKHKQTNKHKP